MFNVVDLFAGPGGMSLGFEIARNESGKRIFRSIKAVENDPWSCKTLGRNFSKEIVIEGDIRDENTKSEIEKSCKGKTDVVVAGPPCQSFSLIGPRVNNGKNGTDKNKYDDLYREFIEVVKRLSPKFVVFENVKGILSKKNGNEKVIDIILSELSKLGYKCGDGNSYDVLNAADYGVPQIRERVFIIGNNMGLKNPVPQKTYFNPLKETLIKWGSEMLPYVTIYDAIGDLPKVKAKKTMTRIRRKRREDVKKYNRRANSGSEKIKYLPEWKKRHVKRVGESGRGFFSFVRPSSVICLTHHTARQQMESDIKLFRGMKEGMTAKNVIESKDPNIKKLSKYIRYNMKSFKDKYKKQRWKEPCSTIFAHLQKDGNRFIHPDSRQARTITPREAARIQSFPDNFYFEGPLTKKFQQIGNAVPPLLAKNIAEEIAKIM